jgi:hypothetical protein
LIFADVLEATAASISLWHKTETCITLGLRGPGLRLCEKQRQSVLMERGVLSNGKKGSNEGGRNVINKEQGYRRGRGGKREKKIKAALKMAIIIRIRNNIYCFHTIYVEKNALAV